MAKNLTFNFNNTSGAKKPANWAFMRKNVRPSRLAFVRNGLMDERKAALLIAHREKINPEGKPLKGLYGASANDFDGVLLPTDANEVYMVDTHPIKVPELRQALANWGKNDRLTTDVIKKAIKTKLREGYWNANDYYAQAENLIIFDLKALGVRQDTVKIGINSAGDVIVRFRWAYPGNAPRQRVFTFICADLTNISEERSELLKKLLKPRGVDFYFQKAACGLIAEMDRYIPTMAEAAARFILISPTAPYICYLGVKPQLAGHLSPKFALNEEVNDAYAQYFENPAQWHDRLHPYSWYLEYWRRVEN